MSFNTAGKPSFSKPNALPQYPVFLLIGEAGAGKTHLSMTVGKGNKGIHIDFEGGADTFSSPTFRNAPDAVDIDAIDVIPVYDRFVEGMYKSPAEMVYEVEGTLDYLIRTKNADGYSVLVVDSLTQFQDMFLTLSAAKDPRQAYGAMKDALSSIMMKAKKAPLVVVFTSRPKTVEDEAQKIEVVRSDLAPGSWAVVSGLADAVGHYTTRTQGAKTHRVLDFTHGSRFKAKNRYGLTELVNPTMRQLLEVIRENSKAQPATSTPAVTPPRRIGTGTPTRPAVKTPAATNEGGTSAA